MGCASAGVPVVTWKKTLVLHGQIIKRLLWLLQTGTLHSCAQYV